MAFNFNWSPLIADTSRARDMLTTALNKSPKPPIIVDDIIVTELNLGSVPPELEILEIGDLAEDRFRGIFRMQYNGDAFLTLKTRVQANPLNTYLSSKPSFASPEPLAAASGLTIPLQITLSTIKLSGFVILVFSKQKGITLVFRNDPLESLKVSSTFDSIPFIKNYLQKEIEGQLRVLFMEDLPAIIHRLSLQLWSPEHQSTEANANSNRVDGGNGETAVDPLATPSQRPTDAARQLEDPEFPSLSLDTPPSEYYPSFSAKNLLRLAALSDSHRTLSLFTPPIRDVVFRAWAGTAERAELSPAGARTTGFSLASLSRQHSTTSSVSSVYSLSDGGMTTSSAPVRPALSSNVSVLSGPASTMGGGRRAAHGQRKRKNRVVDLRKQKAEPAPAKDVENPSRASTPTSSSYAPSSSAAAGGSFEADDELVTPPDSPEKKNKNRSEQSEKVAMPLHSPKPQRVESIRKAHDRIVGQLHLDTSDELTPTQHRRQSVDPAAQSTARAPRLQHSQSTFAVPPSQSPSTLSPPSFPYGAATSGGILEQAWMMKMASDLARKAQNEKDGSSGSGSPSGLKRPEGFWRSSSSDGGSQAPPPAYAA